MKGNPIRPFATRRRFLGGMLVAGCLPMAGCLSALKGAQGPSFALFNDVHESVSFFPRLVPMACGCDFTVLAGDVVNDVRDDGSLDRLLLEPMAMIRRETGVSCEFVRGNHEMRGPAADRLPAALGFADGVLYRARTVKGVRFVFLDTCENRPLDGIKGDRGKRIAAYLEQERLWLEREIASPEWKDARARFVILHIPPTIVNPDLDTRAKVPVQWSVRPGPVTALHDLLGTANVTAMFSGHIHIAAFDEPWAVRPYPVIVGGGHSDPKDRRLTEALLTRCDVGETGFTVRQFALDGSVRHRRFFPF
ncbi:MAG: metallophosphoesterase [Kiritimatiellae bacterium]|nr:metallophosphoesterase [Kiritimatiellia bacterium]